MLKTHRIGVDNLSLYVKLLAYISMIINGLAFDANTCNDASNLCVPATGRCTPGFLKFVDLVCTLVCVCLCPRPLTSGGIWCDIDYK